MKKHHISPELEWSGVEVESVMKIKNTSEVNVGLLQFCTYKTLVNVQLHSTTGYKYWKNNIIRGVR